MARKKRRPAPKELFLSHSSRNRRFAAKLASVLRDHGVPVWFSETHIAGAQQWHDEIGSALDRCDWFLLVLSPSSVKSRWVKRELLYALEESRYDGRIVPLLYRRCDIKDVNELSWTLSSLQRVDFTRNFDHGCEELLRIWSMTYSSKA